MPAKKLDDVFKYFHNKPISKEDFDDLYVVADKGRGGPNYVRLQRRLADSPDGNLKLLIAGHRGCGKTTELVRLQKNIEDDFIILNFSVLEELDIQNISYIELFIATMEKLFHFFRIEKRITIEEQYLSDVKNWMKSREIETINQDYMGLDVETGLKSGINIPFFADFFAKFRAAAKSSTSMKEILRSKVEPKLSNLIRNCNVLIDEIKAQLSGIDKKGLVIVIEDLDKLDLHRGADMFYDHSTQLTQLNCHCIFTFPIALLYNIKFKAIENNYEKAFVLPMIKVHEKTGMDCQDGIEVMEKIIARRMDLSLFDNSNILSEMIRRSGGCLWDIFRIIKEATDNALDFGRMKINQTDYRAAYLSLKSDYERTIAENKDAGVTVNEYFESLRDCALDEKKKPKITDAMLDLMNNLTVLGYNGDNWHDVHPIVRDILKERGMLDHES